MNITDSGANGIFGTDVNGFVVDWCILATAHHAIRFGDESDNSINGLVGSVPAGPNPTRITNSLFSNLGAGAVSIFNTSGTLTELDVTNSTFTSAGDGPGFLIATRSTAVATAVATVIVTGSTFRDSLLGLQGSALARSNLTLKILGETNMNTFSGNIEGVRCSNQDDADMTCEVSNNTFTGNLNNAIFVGNETTLTDRARLNGKIQNNDVTMPPDGSDHIILSSLSGTNSASGSSSAALLISGNTVIKDEDDGIGNFNFNGIHVNTTFNPATPNPNPMMEPNFRVTVTRNNVKNTANGLSAISLNALGKSSPCFNVLLNTTEAPGGSGVLVSDFTSGIVRLEQGMAMLSAPASDVLRNNNADLGSSEAASVQGNVRVVVNGFCATFTPP